MQQLGQAFITSAVGALAVVIIGALAMIVRTLYSMSKNIKAMDGKLAAVATNSCNTLKVLRPLLVVNRTQMDMWTGVQPNGNVEKAYKALDEGDGAFNEMVDDAVEAALVPGGCK
jgi:hypothetical protein